MFNDKFLLTKAVLDGTKIMTRRLLKEGTPLGNWEETAKMLRYKIGEVVAVAQRYSDIGAASFDEWERETNWFKKGFTNKMFVRADLMPHHIKTTNVKVERLQYITDEDCLKEGIIHLTTLGIEGYGYLTSDGKCCMFDTPREAYAELINKICGKGTWERNPWVGAYTFETVD